MTQQSFSYLTNIPADTNYQTYNFNKSLTELLNFYGLKDLEDIIIAALIQQCPVLLIGTPGTAKTKFAISIFELLNLNYAHYNAAMLSLDELVGYPIKLPNGKIIYQPLPSSCWDKQAIFIDEISRCKPDLQNKFFSLIYEKKIYGISLPNLIYCWAAMNPPRYDDDNIPETLITECVYPLDVALADRFNYIVTFPNFYELSDDDKRRLIEFSDETIPKTVLSQMLENIFKMARDIYPRIVSTYTAYLNRYLYILAEELVKINLHISARRIRILRNNILWNLSVNTVRNSQKVDVYKVFYLTTVFSLPYKAYIWFDEKKLSSAINHSIELIGLKYDIKSKIYFQRDPIERLFVCLEAVKDKKLEFSTFWEMLESTLQKTDNYKKVCFVTAGFWDLANIQLSANIADSLCFEFMKYTSEVVINEHTTEDKEDIVEIRPTFNAFKKHLINIEYETFDRLITSLLSSSEYKKFKEVILCTALNYICEKKLRFDHKEELEDFLTNYAETFIRYKNRFKKIFDES